MSIQVTIISHLLVKSPFTSLAWALFSDRNQLHSSRTWRQVLKLNTREQHNENTIHEDGDSLTLLFNMRANNIWNIRICVWSRKCLVVETCSDMDRFCYFNRDRSVSNILWKTVFRQSPTLSCQTLGSDAKVGGEVIKQNVGSQTMLRLLEIDIKP